MRVMLIGTPADRARLRMILPDDVQIAGEVSSMSEVYLDGHDHDVDAWIVAPVSATREDDTLIEPLTPREHQVLELLAEGLPNKMIAARLGISDQTAKFHVASICGKLGASNRTEAVRIALRRGLLVI
jgi:DNA-binding NarL/FixJ family response regulator